MGTAVLCLETQGPRPVAQGPGTGATFGVIAARWGTGGSGSVSLQDVFPDRGRPGGGLPKSPGPRKYLPRIGNKISSCRHFGGPLGKSPFLTHSNSARSPDRALPEVAGCALGPEPPARVWLPGTRRRLPGLPAPVRAQPRRFVHGVLALHQLAVQRAQSPTSFPYLLCLPIISLSLSIWGFHFELLHVLLALQSL